MTEDAEGLLVGAALAAAVGLLLQASVPGIEGGERLILLGMLPALLGVVAGRFLPRFLLVGLAIVLVVQAPEANEAELAATSVAAVAAMAIGLGIGVGGRTASITLAAAPISVLWIALQYGEPVSVPVLALLGGVTVVGLATFGHDRTASPWSAIGRRWMWGLAAAAAVVPVIVVAALLMPRLDDGGTADASDGSDGAADARPGDGDATGTFSYPGFGSELDISDPVELGDEVVFRVDTDRSTYWRVGTFADFDGERWTVGSAPSDPGSPTSAVRFEQLLQTFTVERPLAGQIPTAWSPLGASLWDRFVAPGPDGTVFVERTLTRGETYTAVSALPIVGADDLRRAKGPVPDALLDVYAAPPSTSDRVRETALRVTEGETSDFDRVVALEAWMAQQVEYGRDIEPMPEGVDVVDHFLFESRLGFCEQIGTSLVVMARSLGLPARLVVGFVPEERDEGAGAWVVRERNAHAWAEIWFPEVGWQAFDPTSSVPLSAESLVQDDPGRDLLVPALILVAVVATAVALALVVRLVAARRSGGRGGHRAAEGLLGDRLVDLADRAGVDVGPPRTVRMIGADVAARLDVDEVGDVAAMLDEVAFTGRSLGPADSRRGGEILDRAEEELRAQDEQESMEQPALVRAHSGRRSAKRSRPG